MTAGCADCLTPMDPALAKLGYTRHPTCTPGRLADPRGGRPQLRVVPAAPEPYEPVPADACDVGWKCPGGEPPMQYPGGRYCGHHARMMTPRVQWAAGGVPEPPDARAARAAKAAGAAEAAAELEAEPG